MTKHREDVEKVAKLLLQKEVITRYVTFPLFPFINVDQVVWIPTTART